MGAPYAIMMPVTSCRPMNVLNYWWWPTLSNSVICRRVRSCLVWLTRAATSPRNRRFTGCCVKRNSLLIGAVNDRPAFAANHAPYVPTGPNQLFSRDITYLPTTVRGQYFYLYLFMDVFSRMVVGWQVYADESGAQASELLKDLCAREAIKPGQVILHSDNGGPMKGATMLATLQALGVMPSLSRPGVSNYNPFSESLFKTLKYRPAYPMQAFDTLFAARAWVSGLVRWYNHEHRHSAIRFVTPAQRHINLDQQILDRRATLYEAAKQRNPLRWKGSTRNWKRVHTVHLNPDQTDNFEPIKRDHRHSSNHSGRSNGTGWGSIFRTSGSSVRYRPVAVRAFVGAGYPRSRSYGW